MKMEVLSVQNQFQGQFSVIGSTKVKDWTSPLTPPPPLAPVLQQNKSLNNTQSDNVIYDRQPRIHKTKMETAGTAAIEGSANCRFAYNNNLLCCEATTLISSAAEAAQFVVPNDDVDAGAVHELSRCLQSELRAAKSQHLACTEVSLPWSLTPRIAAEIIKTSEREPCGVRGCTIFIEFEDEPNQARRRIASFKVDPNTVSTFELYLTLKHDKSGWTSLLPQFLKNLTRSSTILISPDFSLTKNKLYSCE